MSTASVDHDPLSIAKAEARHYRDLHAASRKECDRLRDMGDALLRKVARAERRRRAAEQDASMMEKRLRQLELSLQELRAREKVTSERRFTPAKASGLGGREEGPSLREGNDKTMQQLATQISKAEKLKRTANELANENASLRSHLDVLRCDAERSKDRLKRSAQELEALKADRREKTEVISKLGPQVESLSADKKDLEAAIARLTSDNDGLVQLVQDLQGEVSSLRTLCDEADGKVPDLEQQASDWQQEAQELRGALTRVRIAFDQSRREREHWKQQSVQATHQFSDMDERVAELTIRLKALELENAQLRRRRGDPESSIVDSDLNKVLVVTEQNRDEEELEWQLLTQRMTAIAASS
ncbi:hypothetical protein FOZ60_015236 [Perkinsus olseni]|uniref:Uncharacterized protein n=1 Tax=Perkinsus olseni TaxID=32597 RepID=A0A7J6N6B5_PEROL|nr:hypothetical protein FOZ60_015236 [Perkinsus olseni]